MIVHCITIIHLNEKDTSIGSEATVEQVTEAVGRVCLVSWKEETQDAVYIPELADCEAEGKLLFGFLFFS